MSATDMVDAALVGFDRRELVKTPCCMPARNGMPRRPHGRRCRAICR